MKTDKFYMVAAKNAALASRCHKRQVGCVLAFTDGSYINGTNGPPKPLSKCEPCPRMVRNSISGIDLDLCKAIYAERQVLLIAAKMGYVTDGAILYSYMGVPCKDCLIELCEAGIKEIVCLEYTFYDKKSKEILNEWIKKGLKFRIFEEK